MTAVWPAEKPRIARSTLWTQRYGAVNRVGVAHATVRSDGHGRVDAGQGD